MRRINTRSAECGGGPIKSLSCLNRKYQPGEEEKRDRQGVGELCRQEAAVFKKTLLLFQLSSSTSLLLHLANGATNS